MTSPLTQTYVKISEYQDSWFVQCLDDGSLRERATSEWWKTWEGSWDGDAARGLFDIDGYRLQFAFEPRALGIEHARWDPDRRVRFVVLPTAGTFDAETVGRHRLALVKFTGGSTKAHFAELLPEGVVIERDPWTDDQLDGVWRVDQGRLHVVVGEYHWSGDFVDADGLYLGRESGPWGDQAIPAALVRLPTTDPSFTTPDGMERDSILFEHDGWTFREFGTSRGAFAEVLEATKPREFGVQRWAAKCFRPGRDREAEREVGHLRRLGGKTGIISVGDYFRLPSDPDLGNYQGVVVQFIELYETDLAHHLHSTGAMRSADVVRLAVRLGGAAVELHDYFHVLHNDIRPANVVGRPADVDWKLTDFNVAVDFDPLVGGARMPGTAFVCMSPALVEQWQASAGDDRWKAISHPADDMWAIGLTLLQAASGVVFPADRPVDATEALARVRDCSPNVRSMLQGCLEQDEHRRWTAAELRAEATRVHTFLLMYDA